MARKRPFSLIELLAVCMVIAMMAALVLRPSYRAMERLKFDYSCQLLKERAKALRLSAETSESRAQAKIQFSESRLIFQDSSGPLVIDGVKGVWLDGKRVTEATVDVFPRVGFGGRRLEIEGPKKVLIF